MKMITIIPFVLLAFVGCQEEKISESSILSNWEVESIYEGDNIIIKENPNDSIIIEFKEDGTLQGSSSRNLLLGQYATFSNDSIWVSTIGGTEVNDTYWAEKFIEIMPLITFYEFNEVNRLLFYSINRDDKIVFIKK